MNKMHHLYVVPIWRTALATVCCHKTPLRLTLHIFCPTYSVLLPGCVWRPG